MRLKQQTYKNAHGRRLSGGGRKLAQLQKTLHLKALMSTGRLCDHLSLDDFLSFDGPTGVTVAPDDTRENFFLHLGLDNHNYRHRLLYKKMKQEARAGMRRLFETRDCLHPHLVHDETVSIPYSLEQITELAFRGEVGNIYEKASKQTREFYAIIGSGDGSNWAIRWMLWRVVQSAQRRSLEAQPNNHDLETECTPSSVGSTVMDFPSPTAETEQTSPMCWISPREASDAEPWTPSQTVVKPDPDMPFHKPDIARHGFWEHVMNDT